MAGRFIATVSIMTNEYRLYNLNIDHIILSTSIYYVHVIFQFVCSKLQINFPDQNIPQKESIILHIIIILLVR